MNEIIYVSFVHIQSKLGQDSFFRMMNDELHCHPNIGFFETWMPELGWTHETDLSVYMQADLTTSLLQSPVQL